MKTNSTPAIFIQVIGSDQLWMSCQEKLVRDFALDERAARKEFEKLISQLIGTGHAAHVWFITDHDLTKTIEVLWEFERIPLEDLRMNAMGMQITQWMEENYPGPDPKKLRESKKQELMRQEEEREKEKKRHRNRVLMTFDKDEILDGQIGLLYKHLIDWGFIRGSEADFRRLFSGERSNCSLVWCQGGQANLVYLFEQLVANHLIRKKPGLIVWQVLQGHFTGENEAPLNSLNKHAPASEKFKVQIDGFIAQMYIDTDRIAEQISTIRG